MGQCSSSIRPANRPPSEHSDESGRPESLATSAINRLRRRRSTEGSRPQQKRQRPHDDDSPSVGDTEGSAGLRLEGIDDTEDIDPRLRNSVSSLSASSRHPTLDSDIAAPSNEELPDTQAARRRFPIFRPWRGSTDASTGPMGSLRTDPALAPIRDAASRTEGDPQNLHTTDDLSFSEEAYGRGFGRGARSSPQEHSLGAALESERADIHSPLSSTGLPTTFSQAHGSPHYEYDSRTPTEPLGSTLSQTYPSSPSGDEDEADSQFFDAPSFLPPASPPRRSWNPFGSRRQNSPSQQRDFVPSPPRTRPPPPPSPPPSSGPQSWSSGRRNTDGDDEQATVLSHVLLAAATLTATHLVGELITRGELYSGTNQDNANSVPDSNEPRADGSDGPGAPGIQPNSNAGAAETPSVPDFPGTFYRNDDTYNGISEETREPEPEQARAPGAGASSTVTFPEFLEQLRSGRHSTELTRIMFDTNRASSFFRFFRFPEDGQGRIPILLMGIRSSENIAAEDVSESGETQFLNHSEASISPRTEGGLGLQFGSRPRSTHQDSDDNMIFSSDEHDESEASRRLRHRERLRNGPTWDQNWEDGLDDDEEEEDEDDEADDDEDEEDDDDDATEEPIFEDRNPSGRDFGSSMLMDALLDGILGRTIPAANARRDNNDARPLAQRRPSRDIWDTRDEPTATQRPGRSRSNSSSLASSAGSEESESNRRPTNQRRSHHSWVVYVIGGSYPPTHPIFFAPSLLTSNPTYEDMLIVEQLLGPSKPPVATRDDVASAGGLFTIEPGSALLKERCPICLTDYAEEDVCRELPCRHVFHQECVDSWLTRSHNSCPMCRNEGVPLKQQRARSGQQA